MISESLDHAFDDMNKRAWTEARLKGEEMLGAIAVAFERVGDSIDSDEREMIQRAAAQLREALETNNLKHLQAANTNLDNATQGLAAAIVEKAMRTAPIAESA